MELSPAWVHQGLPQKLGLGTSHISNMVGTLLETEGGPGLKEKARKSAGDMAQHQRDAGINPHSAPSSGVTLGTQASKLPAPPL